MTEILDIAIIGGGIVGATLAYALKGRRSIVLLEQEDALGYHATGRSAAEFTRRFHSEPVGRLTQASADFLMRPPEGFSDVALLRHRGNLLIAGQEKKDHLLQTFAYEAEHMPDGGAPLQLMDMDAMLEKVPFLDPDWVSAGFYDPDCWDIEVDNLLQAYVKAARRDGAIVQQSCQVLSATKERDHWVIETSKGTIRARLVVNASGGWADQVAGLFGVDPLHIIPHRRTAISIKVPDHDLSDMPEVNEIDEVFYFKPDAGQLMVSPADETPVAPHDAWPEEMDIAYAAHYLSECTVLDIQHVAHSWAGLRTLSPDRLPVIGPSSSVDGYFWLAGLGGYGIQTSPAVGLYASALLLGEPLPPVLQQAGLVADQFSPSRF